MDSPRKIVFAVVFAAAFAPLVFADMISAGPGDFLVVLLALVIAYLVTMFFLAAGLRYIAKYPIGKNKGKFYTAVGWILLAGIGAIVVAFFLGTGFPGNYIHQLTNYNYGFYVLGAVAAVLIAVLDALILKYYLGIGNKNSAAVGIFIGLITLAVFVLVALGLPTVNADLAPLSTSTYINGSNYSNGNGYSGTGFGSPYLYVGMSMLAIVLIVWLLLLRNRKKKRASSGKRTGLRSRKKK